MRRKGFVFAFRRIRSYTVGLSPKFRFGWGHPRRSAGGLPGAGFWLALAVLPRTTALASDTGPAAFPAHVTQSNSVGSSAGWIQQRPRLFFTPDRVARLKRRAETEPAIGAGWLALRARADRLLREELVPLEDCEGGQGSTAITGGPTAK